MEKTSAFSEAPDVAKETGANEQEMPNAALNLESVVEKLNEIQSEINASREAFDKKIMIDAHKNAMFDNMHKELCDYKNGVFERNIDSMALDAISIIDTYEAIAEQDDTDEGTAEIIRNIIQDLVDMLYRQGIEMYSSIGEDMTVNTKSQKIIKTVVTSDETLNNKICAQLAPGYCKGDRIIRAEKISIYKYKGE